VHGDCWTGVARQQSGREDVTSGRQARLGLQAEEWPVAEEGWIRWQEDSSAEEDEGDRRGAG